LQALVDRGEGRDHEFVLRVLMAYHGEAMLLPLCRAIVVALPPDSDLLDMVDNVLDRSGMVHGEFGFVEQLQRRKGEIAGWLEDDAATVRAFVKRRTRNLDLQIAVEQRRSLEGLELRKRAYDE
jgi:hypothetical protein